MTLWYNATHSVSFIRTIDGKEVRKNSWSDWHAVPSSRPHPEPPEVKTNYVDIPGANGSIDMSEAVAGHILYQNVKGDIELILRNGYPGTGPDYLDKDKPWFEVYNDMLNFLHGKVCKIVFEDLVNPENKIGWYWEGRTTVSSITSEKMYTKIKIDYNAYPFPIERDCSEDPPLEPTDDEPAYTPTINGSITIADSPIGYFAIVSDVNLSAHIHHYSDPSTKQHSIWGTKYIKSGYIPGLTDANWADWGL